LWAQCGVRWSSLNSRKKSAIRIEPKRPKKVKKGLKKPFFRKEKEKLTHNCI